MLLLLLLMMMMMMMMLMPKGHWHHPIAAGQTPPPKVKVGVDAHAELFCAFAQLFHRAIMGRKADKRRRERHGHM